MSIRIVTDSSCDLPQVMVDVYGITVVLMYINIGAESYLDGVTMSRQEFHEGLPQSMPWSTVSLVDLYVGFALFLAGSSIVRDRHSGRSCGWC